MRNHEIAVAWIHIVAGLFVLVLTSILWWSASGLASIFKGSWLPQAIGMFGRPIAMLLIVLAVLELVGAIALLRAQGWGRTIILGTSILEFFIFPIGTAIAAYTYWVLLVRRER